ncbi:MAG: hypothetical protein J7556_21350 [Acidovorax sp.]|nr:hypothetical protein [Acidovorax sp.]
MDMNQLSAALASALVRVVESAKPAQEYCLLWIDWWPICMTKAEWSGWMQAIGAILAILASFALVRHQLKEQQLLVKRAAVSRIRTFVAFSSSYAEGFLGIDKYTNLEMRRQSALLNEQIAMAATIPSELLNIEWIAALEGTRSIAVQFRVLVDAVAEDPRLGPQAREVGKQLAEKLADFEKTVVQDHPGFKIWPHRRNRRSKG